MWKEYFSKFFISSILVFNNKYIMPTYERKEMAKVKKNLASQQVVFINKTHLHVRTEKSSHPQPPPPPHNVAGVSLFLGVGGGGWGWNVTFWSEGVNVLTGPPHQSFSSLPTALKSFLWPSTHFTFVQVVQTCQYHVSTWCHSPLFCSWYRSVFFSLPVKT